MADATGVEPIYPGSKPGTFPLCYTPLYKRRVAARGVKRLPYTRERRYVPNGSPLPLGGITRGCIPRVSVVCVAAVLCGFAYYIL